MKSGWIDVAVTIFLWFFCIPISVFIAYYLESIFKKKVPKTYYTLCLTTILLVFFTGTLLMGIYTPRITNRAPKEDIVIELDSRSKTKELYYAGIWLAENSENDDKLLGDMNVYEIFSGFFKYDVNMYPSLVKQLYLGNADDILDMIYWEDFEFGIAEHTHHYDKLHYFIINNAFLNYYSCLFGKPISSDNLNKFNEIPLLDKVYNNDEIQIYKIERGESEVQ